jgi:hypothetical protein
MEKINYREFNSPKEFSLGNIKKGKLGKIIQIPIHFKDVGYEYNFQLHYPHKPTKYNGTGNVTPPIEWDNLREELSIAQINRIVVHKKSKSVSITFCRFDDVEIHIVCKDITGLP